MAVTNVSDAEFMIELDVHNKVIVRFYTEWCGSCRLIKPKYNRMSEELQFAEIRFLDINPEKNLKAKSLANVSHYPTFAIFHHAKYIDSIATTKEDVIVELINKLKLMSS